MRSPSKDTSQAESARLRQKGELYSNAASSAEQPPLTAMIPQRAWTLWVVFLLAISGGAAIQSLYSSVYLSLPAANRVGLEALDVLRSGSLCGWYSGTLFVVAGAFSALIYHLRRHKLDDYRGRYRIWVWTIPALALASVDAATGLHIAVGRALVELSRTTWAGETLWWMMTVGGSFALLGLRMLVEMRRCKAAVATLLLAAANYAVGGSFQFDLIRLDDGLLTAMTATSTVLLGHVLIVMTTAIYSRYVYREAQGLIATRTSAARSQPKATVAKPAPAKQAAAKKAPPRVKNRPTIRINDDAHDGPAGNSDSASTADTQDSDQVAGEVDPHRMSKAERRRLRKQQRRQNRDAA
jgi:hypothetical protein